MREAPLRLRCEYLDNPLGIDTCHPRLSWWVNDSRDAELQTAYQIQASATRAGLESGGADLWDSGHVSSRQTVNVAYRGRALGSGARVWWRVRCYDSDGTTSPWSDAARFELGPLESADWQCEWIAAPLAGSPESAVPVPLLFRDFDLDALPDAARLDVAALGCARMELNGQPVADDLEPFEAWHDLTRRVPYRVHDVTALLHAGRNRLAVLLGDGDYCGHLAGGRRQRYGARPALYAQLRLDFADGKRRTVGSDLLWHWRPSWILRGDRELGEEVDGRQHRPDWSQADALAGYPVDRVPLTVRPVAAVLPPARRVSEVSGVRVPGRERNAAAARLQFDLGRSVLGRLRLRLRAPADALVTVRYSDAVPDAARVPGLAHAEGPRLVVPGVDRYTCRGDGEELFETGFTLRLFSRVEIEVDRQPCEIVRVSVLEVGSAAPQAAELHCDHRLLESLFRTAAHTCRAGLALGPVSALDAAHRYVVTADTAATLGAAAACLDGAALLRGWLQELAAWSDGRGGLPACFPEDAAPEEADPDTMLPALWFAYRYYADERLLGSLFPVVQRHLRDSEARWAALLRTGADGTASVSQQMLGTLWYGYGLSLATRIAGVLGRLADLERYDAQGEQVRQAFRRRFVTPGGLLAGDEQLGYVLALALGWLDDTQREAAVERLASQIRGDGFHLRVDLRHGDLLLEVLTLEGRMDVAYQALMQTTAPGWLHPLGTGASVLWDEACGLPGRLAAGCVAGWLQRFLLGLELDDDLTPELNAFRRARIQPRPPLGPAFGAGTAVGEAHGHLDTVHGRYECAWRVDGDAFHLNVRVPANGSARIILPDGSASLVDAGRHTFDVHLADQAASAAADEAPAIPVLHEISGGH